MAERVDDLIDRCLVSDSITDALAEMIERRAGRIAKIAQIRGVDLCVTAELSEVSIDGGTVEPGGQAPGQRR